MSVTQTLAFKPATVVLMLLMAVTRFNHFGSAISLPDASLAVFFLAGLWIGGAYLFVSLLLEAGLIDYLAISQLGVSDFCISQAYVFLIPTYGVMYLGGKWCSQFTTLSLANAIKQIVALVAATSTAFLVSNGSFFLFSGRYPEVLWSRYIDSFAMYYPPYLTSTLIYGIGVFGFAYALKSLQATKNTHEAI